MNVYDMMLFLSAVISFTTVFGYTVKGYEDLTFKTGLLKVVGWLLLTPVSYTLMVGLYTTILKLAGV